MIKVAFVGRPNVGKSSLFNRLTRTKTAIIHDLPGVTRDRRYGNADLFDLKFQIIDTAGTELQHTKATELQTLMESQTFKAADEADIIFFIFDAREGITPIDEELAAKLRAYAKPVILLGNKAEGVRFQHDYTAYKLGLGDPIYISAVHGEGMIDLYSAMMKCIKTYGISNTDVLDEMESDSKTIELAIIGRPNVGKSTLVNALLNEDRQLVGPMAGLTRDSIAIDWHYKDYHIKLVDTAGQRKRSNVDNPIEKLAVTDALRSIQYCNVAALILDASYPLEKQDLHIARHVVDEGRALIIVLNKWDIAKDQKQLLAEVHHELEHHFALIKQVPILTISALQKTGLSKLMDAVIKVYQLWNVRLTTGQLNQWLRFAVEEHAPPLINGRRIKLKYVTQIKTRPPTFHVFSNLPKDIPEDYRRYLINSLRKSFDLPSVPLRFIFRGGGNNPYHTKDSR
jgi:GTP-binding protein